MLTVLQTHGNGLYKEEESPEESEEEDSAEAALKGKQASSFPKWLLIQPLSRNQK